MLEREAVKPGHCGGLMCISFCEEVDGCLKNWHMY